MGLTEAKLWGIEKTSIELNNLDKTKFLESGYFERNAGMTFSTIICSLYLGLSGIYWLPILEDPIVKAIKYSLFFLILFMAITNFRNRTQNSLLKGLFGPLGLMGIFMLYLPSILLAETNVFFEVALNIISYYTFFWSIYSLSMSFKINNQSILSGSLKIVLVFVVIHILASFVHLPLLIPPSIENSNDTFLQTGFNLSRTGWSNGLALFVPIALSRRVETQRWLFTGLILYSQFVCGGRSGLLTSILIILIHFYFQGSFRRGILVVSILATFVLFNLELVLTALRFERLKGKINYSTLNDFSANRIVGYEYGINKWLENPIFGNGIKNVNIQKVANVNEIHNFWIKTLAESGIFSTIILILFVVMILRESYKVSKLQRNHLVFFLILLGGTLETFFEPNVVFGSFQNSAIWWFALGSVLYYKFQLKKVGS